MNNKGQSLITFILILPVLLLIVAFIIDLSIVSLNRNKIDGVIRDNLEVILDKDIKDVNKINDIFKENEVNIDSITIYDDEIMIVVHQKIDSLFGGIIKLKIYEINNSYVGNYQTKIIG